MDFTRIKNLIRGNGEKLILVENGEPEAVVMSFTEYVKLTGVVSAAPAVAGGAAMPAQAGHATEEQFDMPSRDEWHGVDTGEETKLVMDEWSKTGVYEPSIRLADIRLEDLPI